MTDRFRWWLACAQDFVAITLPALIGRAARLPVCDACQEVHWQGTASAYASGWRSSTWTADTIAMLCPGCQEPREWVW